MVTKVLIGPNKEAYGVQVNQSAVSRKYFSRLSVILSAGTVNTPQLLMLSGIGPKQHQNSKNISCKVNLPMVGQNLQDHFFVPIHIATDDVFKEQNEATQNFDAIQYLFNRTGRLAQNAVSNIQAYYSINDDPKYPMFQNHLRVLPKNSSEVISLGYSKLLRYKDEYVNSVIELNKNHTLFTFAVNLLHPYSTGNITLFSNNITDHPIIQPNDFEDSRDLIEIVAAIKKVIQIKDTKYFKSINATLGEIGWSSCNKFVIGSDDYWKCISLNTGTTFYHPVGTAMMGLDEKTSVVDDDLRVHGVRNLRIIDASVMPTITTGNTNAPVIMIAERGADLVKKDFLLNITKKTK